MSPSLDPNSGADERRFSTQKRVPGAGDLSFPDEVLKRERECYPFASESLPPEQVSECQSNNPPGSDDRVTLTTSYGGRSPTGDRTRTRESRQKRKGSSWGFREEGPTEVGRGRVRSAQEGGTSQTVGLSGSFPVTVTLGGVLTRRPEDP